MKILVTCMLLFFAVGCATPDVRLTDEIVWPGSPDYLYVRWPTGTNADDVRTYTDPESGRVISRTPLAPISALVE